MQTGNRRGSRLHGSGEGPYEGKASFQMVMFLPASLFTWDMGSRSDDEGGSGSAFSYNRQDDSF